ncbi:MAG: recombinase family protein [Cytophagales bacterium]|nr:recombinase family protein [Cytophagales bacterium]
MELNKKQRAVLYCRVSSDEQKSNTSLGFQQAEGQRYCEKNGYVLDKVYLEDFSGKTYDRPQWNLMIKYLKQHKKHIDLVLFYDYSRFGRETSGGFFWHSYLLRDLGITPQSMTQYIDYNTPEYVYQLSIYLSGPQVENTWRSIKTRNGMIARMNEGRYVCGRLPMGFVKNPVTKDVVHTDKAPLIREAFEMIYRGQTVTDVKVRFARLGFYRSFNTWNKTLRNPYYKGMIESTLLDEPVPARFMQPIIDAHTFDTVQHLLNGKAPKVRVDGEYPLKGFCKCGACGSNLTGYRVTKKKLKSGQYLVKKTVMYYYICVNTECRTNYSLKNMHGDFCQLMDQYTVDPELLPVLRQQLKEVFSNMGATTRQANASAKKHITEIKNRMSALHMKYLDGNIDTADYHSLKDQLGSELFESEKLLQPVFTTSNPSKHADKVLDYLSKMGSIWQEGDIETKTKLQKVVFPEGISYLKEKRVHRTPVVNRMIELISANTAFKSRKASNFQNENPGFFQSGSP